MPTEHGAWIWLLGPFFLGAAAGGRFGVDLIWLLIAGLAVFLLRQPTTIVVKVLAGRRRSRELTPGVIWMGIYATVAALALIPLLGAGYNRLPLLALPGVPVFGWHLFLVSRRAERRRPGVEIVAVGVLSLMAPAAFWVAGGRSDQTAVVLWAICWLQSAASIVFIHLRLHQREMEAVPPLLTRLRQGWRSLAYSLFNLAGGLSLFILLDYPLHIPLAFAILFLDNLHGVLVPAIGHRPTRIGVRQLIFSIVFFVVSSVGMLGRAGA
ncbi:MAG: YwiC-like family protein [Anaerolineales bacterium]